MTHSSTAFSNPRQYGEALGLLVHGIEVDQRFLERLELASSLFDPTDLGGRSIDIAAGCFTIARSGINFVTDLAHTLYAIAKNGPRAFYEGPIAQKVAAAVRNAGGLMTADDLKNYKAVERKPLRGSYLGYDGGSMPPPEMTIPESYQVVVECRDEADQQSVYERMRQEGYRCRVLTL